MQYSYKATLVCLITVVSICGKCGCHEKNITSTTIGSNKPNQEENRLNKDEEANPDKATDKGILEELQKLQEKFKELYDRKMQVTCKEAVMYAIKSIGEEMQLSPEVITKVHKLYEEALDNNCIDDEIQNQMKHNH